MSPELQTAEAVAGNPQDSTHTVKKLQYGNNLRALPLHRAFLISSATLIGRTGTTKILFSSKLFFGELHQDLKHKHIFLYQDRVDFYTELVETYKQASN